MSEEKSTEAIENIKETVDEAVEGIKETVDEAVEAVEEAIDDVKPPLMKLREENPKVFYGAIAGVVGVLAIFMMSGGESKVTQHAANITYAVGQSYTLDAPNALTDTTLKILKVPGQMSAFDNESENDVVCNAPTGTAVKVSAFQDAFGTKQLFAQVEIEQATGDCRQGVKGWTLKTNLR